MRCRRSPEAFQQAQVLYETAARITGAAAVSGGVPEPASPATVTTVVPAYPPLNPRHLELYDLVGDRLTLLRGTLDAERIRNGRPDRDMPYFGDGAGRGRLADRLAGRPATTRGLVRLSQSLPLPDRRSRRPSSWPGRSASSTGALLSAYEKGDAEYLASIHAEQEREMLALGIAIRQDEWRDADWQVQALQQTKDLSQAELLYYVNLYQNGLINNEIQNQDLTTNALAARTSANETEAEGEIMNLIPDPFVGAMSSGTSVPVGSKLAHVFEAVARIMQTVGDIMSTTAAMDATVAGWQRRAVEWLHQTQTLPIEIQQIELQILEAQIRRRDQALRELNNQQRQVENAAEVQDFLRDKFTATDLYLWLQQETAALHRQMYDLALHAATGRRSAPSTSSAVTRPGGSSQKKPGTTCTKGSWPASGSTSRCATWRRPTSTRTGASTSSPSTSRCGCTSPWPTCGCGPPDTARSASQNGCSTSTTPAITCAVSRPSRRRCRWSPAR